MGKESTDECPMMQQRGAQKETRMRRMEGDGMMRRDGSGQGRGGMMQRFEGQESFPEAFPFPNGGPQSAPNDGWMTEDGAAPGMHQMPDGTWMGNDGTL